MTEALNPDGFHANGARRCASPGCPMPGTQSSGGRAWYCWVHTVTDGLYGHAVTQRIRLNIWLAKLIARLERLRIIDEIPGALHDYLDKKGRLDLEQWRGETRGAYIARLRGAFAALCTEGVADLRKPELRPNPEKELETAIEEESA